MRWSHPIPVLQSYCLVVHPLVSFQTFGKMLIFVILSQRCWVGLCTHGRVQSFCTCKENLWCFKDTASCSFMLMKIVVWYLSIISVFVIHEYSISKRHSWMWIWLMFLWYQANPNKNWTVRVCEFWFAWELVLVQLTVCHIMTKTLSTSFKAISAKQSLKTANTKGKLQTNWSSPINVFKVGQGHVKMSYPCSKCNAYYLIKSVEII